jgi:hypothetical protein
MIEKILHHIWIGPDAPPLKWMDTWRKNHPDWEYVLWDNEAVFSRKWTNQSLVDHYAAKKQWHGVADVIRYEILHKWGGFMPGADSECLLPIDELFQNDFELFAVRCGGEIVDWARQDGQPIKDLPPFLLRKDKRLIAPIYAAKAGNSFLQNLIAELANIRVLGEPWKTTGNVFCANMLKKYEPKIMIWPMHYFIPFHPVTIDARTPYVYIGNDKIYAKHFWGTTNHNYNNGRE